MKKAGILLIVCVMALTPSVSMALDDPAKLTEDQIERIKQNCTSTQASLKELQARDALARVNLGQQYETISVRLMAPMNSRIALNKLDGVAATKITVQFNSELDRFRKEAYAQYKQTLEAAISISCYNQPIEFFDTLTLALERRVKVRESVDKMAELTEQYRKEIETLEQRVTGGS